MKKVENMLIANNKKIKFHYQIVKTIECGIILLGSEIKSLKNKHVNFSDSYATLKNGEIFLIGLNIEPFNFATHENHDRNRIRKLLLHKKEINKITKILVQQRLTLIPIKIYLKKNFIKILIGIVKGKFLNDKRQAIKKRDANIATSRILKNYNYK